MNDGYTYRERICKKYHLKHKKRNEKLRNPRVA
jgi:hypothetical protein